MEINVKERLSALCEDKYLKFNQRLHPGVDNMLGIRVPQLRELAKEIAKSDYSDFLAQKDEFYEETLIKGFVIGYAKVDIEKRLLLCENFIPRINCWSVCDTFCSGLKAFKKHPEVVLKFLKKYVNGTEFEQRFVAVCLMCHFINDVNVDELLEIYKQLCHDGYYLKMAVAWGIATVAVKYPEKAFFFMENFMPDTEVLRMTVRKMRDSYRISDENKQKASDCLNHRTRIK